MVCFIYFFILTAAAVGEIIEGKRAKKTVERLDFQAPKQKEKLKIGDGKYLTKMTLILNMKFVDVNLSRHKLMWHVHFFILCFQVAVTN